MPRGSRDSGTCSAEPSFKQYKGLPAEIAVLGSAPGQSLGRCPRWIRAELFPTGAVVRLRCPRDWLPQTLWPLARKKKEPVARTPRSRAQSPDSSAVPGVGARVDYQSTVVCGLGLKVGACRTNSAGSSNRLNDTLHIKRYSLWSSLVSLRGVGCGRELLRLYMPVQGHKGKVSDVRRRVMHTKEAQPSPSPSAPRWESGLYCTSRRPWPRSP